ncbi:hypothetical protein AOLI_G00248730 [Acnodon oligacanthus]
MVRRSVLAVRGADGAWAASQGRSALLRSVGFLPSQGAGRDFGARDSEVERNPSVGVRGAGLGFRGRFKPLDFGVANWARQPGLLPRYASATGVARADAGGVRVSTGLVSSHTIV